MAFYGWGLVELELRLAIIVWQRLRFYEERGAVFQVMILSMKLFLCSWKPIRNCYITKS